VIEPMPTWRAVRVPGIRALLPQALAALPPVRSNIYTDTGRLWPRCSSLTTAG